TADQVVVFLTGRTTGAQRLRLHATMSLTPPQQFELPHVGFVSGAISSRLTLVRQSDVSVDFAAAQQLSRVDAPIDSAPLHDRELLVGHFDLPSAPVPLPLRVESSKPEISTL